MGYTKVVQYGNVTELFQYENDIKTTKGIDHIKASRLLKVKGYNQPYESFDVVKRRKKLLRLQSKKKGIYERSDSSLKRSKKNFFRMCHHNNCHFDSIHFLTLTFINDLPYKTASRHVARFMERVRSAQPEIPVDFISVPELTEAGRFHFHVLIYNLSTRLAGTPIKTNRQAHAKITTERKTRNLQVLFERGYVDIMPATYTSRGIAGYMAKYMGKALADTRYETQRGYNCSRGIKKIYSAGSNTFDKYLSLVLPTEDIEEISNSSYNVPYLGKCEFRKIKIKI